MITLQENFHRFKNWASDFYQQHQPAVSEFFSTVQQSAPEAITTTRWTAALLYLSAGGTAFYAGAKNHPKFLAMLAAAGFASDLAYGHLILRSRREIPAHVYNLHKPKSDDSHTTRPIPDLYIQPNPRSAHNSTTALRLQIQPRPSAQSFDDSDTPDSFRRSYRRSGSASYSDYSRSPRSLSSPTEIQPPSHSIQFFDSSNDTDTLDSSRKPHRRNGGTSYPDCSSPSRSLSSPTEIQPPPSRREDSPYWAWAQKTLQKLDLAGSAQNTIAYQLGREAFNRISKFFKLTKYVSV